MAYLVFNAADVKRVVEHSIAAPEQSPNAYTGGDWGVPEQMPEDAAVILVHDAGVYLMSNGKPRDVHIRRIGGIDNESAYCAYAKGCDPISDSDWWDRSRELVGGDDFAETLPWARVINYVIKGGARHVVLEIKDGEISLIEGTEALQ